MKTVHGEVCGLFRIVLCLERDAAMHLCWKKNSFTSTVLAWSQKPQNPDKLNQYSRHGCTPIKTNEKLCFL